MIREMIDRASVLRKTWSAEALYLPRNYVNDESRARAYRCADWAMRTVLPVLLSDRKEILQILDDMPPIDDFNSSRDAFRTLHHIRRHVTYEVFFNISIPLIACNDEVEYSFTLCGISAIQAAHALIEPPSPIELIRELMEIR